MASSIESDCANAINENMRLKQLQADMSQHHNLTESASNKPRTTEAANSKNNKRTGMCGRATVSSCSTKRLSSRTFCAITSGSLAGLRITAGASTMASEACVVGSPAHRLLEAHDERTEPNEGRVEPATRLDATRNPTISMRSQ